MKYTNKYGLPDAIVQAVQNDDYTKGSADYSATGLMKPPQESGLFRIVSEDPDAEIVVDVADQIWMLFGTAIHSILERGHGVSTQDLLNFKTRQIVDIKDAVVSGIGTVDILNTVDLVLNQQPPEGDVTVEKEVRLYANIGGITVSGQPDWMSLTKQSIEDYKTTTTWKYIRGDFSDWERQLNIYAYLAIVNGYKIKELSVVAIFKDWKKYETGKEGYPPHAVVKIPIKMWSSFDTLEYMIGRIKLHEQAKLISDPSELAKQLPCSPEERWQGETTYALVKEGSKRAYRVFEDRAEALQVLSTKPEYNFEERLGTCKKCDEFCNVAQWCKQYSKPAVNMSKQAVVVEAPKIVIMDAPAPSLLDTIIPEKAETDKMIEDEFPKVVENVKALTDAIGEASIIDTLNQLKAVDTTEMKTTELSEHFDKIKKVAIEKTIEEHDDKNTIPLDTETLKPLEAPVINTPVEKPTENISFDFDDILKKAGF